MKLINAALYAVLMLLSIPVIIVLAIISGIADNGEYLKTYLQTLGNLIQ